MEHDQAQIEDWCRRAVELGADAAIVIDPARVVTAGWVRMKCQFGCDGYGDCRTCPPYSPTPDQTRRLLDEYDSAVLMRIGPARGEERSDELHQRLRNAAADLEREVFLAGHHKAWTLSCGPCEECAECDLDAPCLHPERARPSMEAAGIDVFSTVRDAGWEIAVVRDEQDEYRFFALVLVE